MSNETKVCRLGKQIDDGRVDGYLPEMNRLISGFVGVGQVMKTQHEYVSAMRKVAVKAIESFPVEQVIKKHQNKKGKKGRLETEIKRAELKWVVEMLTTMYCKSGWPIDSARMLKYEPYVRSMVPKFLPACRLFEASMEYEDILNQLRYEAILAIRDGFDPTKAMGSSIKDPVKRAKQIAKKAADPTKALETTERTIVYGRLKNWMIRNRWKFHPDQRGGRSVSLDAILTEANLDLDGCAQNGLITSEELLDINMAEVEADLSVLAEALERGEDVRALFAAMPKARREAVETYRDNLGNLPDVVTDGDDLVVVEESSEADEG